MLPAVSIPKQKRTYRLNNIVFLCYFGGNLEPVVSGCSVESVFLKSVNLMIIGHYKICFLLQNLYLSPHFQSFFRWFINQTGIQLFMLLHSAPSLAFCGVLVRPIGH